MNCDSLELLKGKDCMDADVSVDDFVVFYAIQGRWEDGFHPMTV